MRPLNYLITAVILMLFLFGCDGIQNPHQKIEDIVERIPDVELIPGTENTTLTVKRDGVYSYFRVTVQNVERNPRIANGTYYAWCLQMNVPINTGEEYTGVKLYSTERDTWMNRVSYIENNRARYEQSNPGLSWKDIQVAIWVMLETRSYQLERLANRLPSSVDGYNHDYVKNILQDVKQNGHDFKPGPGDKSIIITNADDDEKQNNAIVPFNCGDTIKDIDGNEYPTVKIGDQCWMAENLRTTRYRDEEDISTGYNLADWKTLTTGAYAIYPHDSPWDKTVLVDITSDEEMVDAYGKLYNWYAVNTGNLCPVGWYVPSDEEWKALEIYLGMAPADADKTGDSGRGTNEGGKLKSERTASDANPRWNSPNTGATNSSGFSGLPGGSRWWSEDFSGIGSGGYWWSSTESSATNAWRRYQLNYRSQAGRSNVDKHHGLSVRCIQNVD